MGTSGWLCIHGGDCRVFFAFDVGYGIDLDAAQRILAAAPATGVEEARRAGISHRRRAPKYLQFRPAPLQIDPHRAERARLAALQVDSAILFEGINNALKLIDDQHLARLYALTAARFHLSDWDQSILRKLHTIDGLYQKLADERSGRRMEIREWIIIILVAVSIVLPFVMTRAK